MVLLLIVQACPVIVLIKKPSMNMICDMQPLLEKVHVDSKLLQICCMRIVALKCKKRMKKKTKKQNIYAKRKVFMMHNVLANQMTSS